MIKNLVVGGLGFIGSNLIDKLIQLDEEVICLDNLSSGQSHYLKKWENYSKFYFLKGDILDSQDIKFEKLWHLACPASPKMYLKDPILTSKINFEGTLNLLNMAKEQNAKVLFASSSEVYGNCKKFPQDELNLGYINTTNPRSCYAHGKRIAETLCFDFKRIYQMDIKVARIFNTYGPRLNKNDGRVISSFINQALNNLPMTIYGDGLQTRSFCYVDDTINALILLMDSDFNSPMNIGNNDEISIIDLAKLIDKKIHNSQKFIFEEMLHEEPERRCPSINLAKNVINWEPEVKLEDGLDFTISFFHQTFN